MSPRRRCPWPGGSPGSAAVAQAPSDPDMRALRRRWAELLRRILRGRSPGLFAVRGEDAHHCAPSRIGGRVHHRAASDHEDPPAPCHQRRRSAQPAAGQHCCRLTSGSPTLPPMRPGRSCARQASREQHRLPLRWPHPGSPSSFRPADPWKRRQRFSSHGGILPGRSLETRWRGATH